MSLLSFHDMNVKDFSELKGNDLIDNIFCKPTSAEEGFEILAEHFLGKDWYTANPIHPDQIRTEKIMDIITDNESYKFKSYPWYKRLFLYIYCLIKDVPIYYYY